MSYHRLICCSPICPLNSIVTGLILAVITSEPPSNYCGAATGSSPPMALLRLLVCVQPASAMPASIGGILHCPSVQAAGAVQLTQAVPADPWPHTLLLKSPGITQALPSQQPLQLLALQAVAPSH